MINIKYWLEDRLDYINYLYIERPRWRDIKIFLKNFKNLFHTGWFFKDFYTDYLFRKQFNTQSPTLSMVFCRLFNHPHGAVYYNSYGLEPDMDCKFCGEDLG